MNETAPATAAEPQDIQQVRESLGIPQRRTRRVSETQPKADASPSERARAVLDRTKLRAAKENAKRAKSITPAADRVWYVACRREHIGVIFTGKPKGVVNANDWFSADKEVNSRWPSGSKIPCQECGAELPFLTNDTGILPNRRFIRSIDRDGNVYGENQKHIRMIDPEDAKILFGGGE